MKPIKIYKGNLEINQGDTTDYSQLEKVTGYLSINSSADLKAPKLESIGGYLSINSSADLKAPKLESVGGDLYINSSADLKALKSVGGYLYIYSSADLKAPKLESVGGYLYINSKISKDLEKRLWDQNRKKNNKWVITNLSSDWLIERVATKTNSEFRINNVTLPFEWFEKIRKDNLSAEEVFAIDNVEHRRIAYEMMDKSKMKDLKDFKILDEGIDEKGNPVKLVSFNVQNMKEDLTFYNCFCPSTMREYYLQMDKETSWKKAKDAMFDLEDVEWLGEW